MKLRSSWPTVVFTIRLIRGRGKLSFGQSRHFPFAFFTRTTLASRSGYSTSRIVTSSLIAFFLSGAKLLRFCLTGLKEGLMFSLCVITVGLIPPYPLVSRRIILYFVLRSG